MPEQFSAKKPSGVKRQEGATLSGVFSARITGAVRGQKTRLESELLSAKKGTKGVKEQEDWNLHLLPS